jgi:toxin CcdB
MAAFDVHRMPDGTMVVELQHAWHETLMTRVVAPLRLSPPAIRIRGLTPEISLAGENHLVAIPEMAAVGRLELRPVNLSLAEHRDAIKRAVDALFDGF